MLISKEFYFYIKRFFKHAHTTSPPPLPPPPTPPPFNRDKVPLDCSSETDLQMLDNLRLQQKK